MTRRLILLGVVFLITLSLILGACSSDTTPLPTPSPTATPTVPSSVPAEYKPLYQELTNEMTQFEGTLNGQWDHSRGQTTFGAELAFANGNIGEGLLAPTTMDNNRILLDRLQAMGVKGVVLAIKFPLLKPDFPRSSEYLQFFKDIIAECHRRGMKVLVESGAIFSGTPYSPVQVDWSKYTTDTFLQGLRDQLLLIAHEVKPDYLTLANEPTTEQALTKLVITPTTWSAFIASTLQKIDRSNGLLVGAGTGTWEPPSYMRRIIGMAGLDYIDLHIYPPSANGYFLERALNYALQARTAGKRITVSEAWLWKASSEELSNGLGNIETIMNRDVYSFWYALDERFIQDIMNLADAAKMDFVSFFWTRNLFAYLDYGVTPHNLTTAQFNRQINQASIDAIQKGELSPLGKYYQDQLHGR